MKNIHNLLYPFIWLVVLTCCTTRNAERSRISYPDQKPDSIALPFLPGIVSRPDSLDFNAAFSIDGKHFYFARSEDGKYDIYVTSFDGKRWGSPQLARFS